MPKLPLFQDEPLNDYTIAAFRDLLTNPDTADKMAVIDGLLDLYNNPDATLSWDLACFVIEARMLSSGMLQNFLFSTAECGHRHRSSKAATMTRQIYGRILEHAAAAGFPQRGAAKAQPFTASRGGVVQPC